MICPFCSHEIEDPKKPCPHCHGIQPLQGSAESKVFSSDEMKTEEDVLNLGKENARARAKNRRKRRMMKVLRTVLILICILGAVAVLFWDRMLGLCLRTFAEPNTYLSYVEGKALRSGTDSFLKFYSSIQTPPDKGGLIGTYKIRFNQDFAKSFGDQGTSVVQLIEWLDGLSVSVDSDWRDGENNTKVSLFSDGNVFLTMRMATDKEGNAYYAMPSLQKGYFMVEKSKNLDLKEILPKEKVIESIFKRYYTKIFEELSDVSLFKGFYEISENQKEDVYILSVRVTEKKLHSILTSIVKEAEYDWELEQVYQSATKELIAKEVLTAEEIPAWEDLVERAKKALAEMEKDIEGEGREIFALEDYINAKHEIVGRKITQKKSGFEIRYFEGEKIAEYFVSWDKIVCSLGGEWIKDTLSMKGVLSIGDTDWFDLRAEKSMEKYMFRLDVSKELQEKQKQQADRLDPSEGGAVSTVFSDFGIQFSWERDGDSYQKSKIGIYVANQRQVTLEMELQKGDAGEVGIPSKDQVSDRETWMQQMNPDDFKKILEESGCPPYLIFLFGAEETPDDTIPE